MDDYSISGPFGSVALVRQFKPPESDILDSICSGGWHQVNERYRIDRPEGSSSFLLLFTVAGQGYARIADRHYTLSAEQMLIIPPKTRCSYRTAPSGAWEFYWLHMDGAHATAVLNQILKTGGNRCTFPLDGIRSLMQMLLHTEGGYADSDLYASRMVSRVLYEILYALRTSRTDHDDAEDELVWKIIRELEEHADRTLDLRELSARHYMSEEHLIRLFRRKTGTTPYRFFRRYRMTRSTHLLIYTNQPVGRIAALLGYADLVSFSIQFKKEFGVSPTEYRRINKVYQN